MHVVHVCVRLPRLRGLLREIAKLPALPVLPSTVESVGAAPPSLLSALLSL